MHAYCIGGKWGAPLHVSKTFPLARGSSSLRRSPLHSSQPISHIVFSMSDTGPPPKRIKRGREDKDDFPTVVVPGTPGLRLDFNDDADGRVIMVTSSSSSGHQSFKFNTSTATSMTVNCGKLRYVRIFLMHSPHSAPSFGRATDCTASKSPTMTTLFRR